MNKYIANSFLAIFCCVFCVIGLNAQVTPPNADSDSECSPDCFDLFFWSPLQDGTGTNIPNVGEGIAEDNNCNTTIDAGVEYEGTDSNGASISGTSVTANFQGTTPWTDSWTFTFGVELTGAIVNLSALFGDSEIAFTDCDGNAISVTDISTGTVIPTGIFSGNDEVQVTGTYDCIIVTVSNDRNDSYNISVGTCLSADPLPPCVTCGTDESFKYLTLSNRSGSGTGATADVELDGVLYGTAEVLFSDLDISEDLNGPAFGAFDNDGGVFLLQIDLCEEITVQQVDVLGLETESQVWIGNSLIGSGATGIPGGFTLDQCGGRPTMAPLGNMVTNTSSSCSNQGMVTIL